MSEAQGTIDAGGVYWTATVAHVLPDGGLRWGRQAARSTSSGEPESSQADGVSGRTVMEEASFGGSLNGQWWKKRASATFGWRRKAGDRHELRVGAGLRPGDFLAVDIEFSNGYPLSSYSELFYEYRDDDGLLQREGGRLYWRAPVAVTRINLNLTPLSRIVIKSQFKEGKLKPEEPVAGESSPASYLSVVDGFWSDGQTRVEYLLGDNWRAGAGYRQIRGDLRLRAYDGGRLFAHFGVIEVRGKQWSVHLAHRDWWWRFYSGHAEGEIKGVMESWPFVAGLLRFLGERRHFVGEGSAEWQYASTGGPVWEYRGFHVRVAADYLHFLPDFVYATWRPKLFGFGIDDLRSDRLEITRADLVRLQLKPCLKWRGISIEGEVSQWLPLSIKKLTKSEPASSEGAASEDKSRVWGGFSAAINVTAVF
ncbi:MAG TPA: hypothetical protein VN285_06715 [Candidatus Deferrimicrobium sp.]|nr:hypothetical protein [Candidatus Deferrimicrobium sp.]